MISIKSHLYSINDVILYIYRYAGRLIKVAFDILINDLNIDYY